MYIPPKENTVKRHGKTTLWEELYPKERAVRAEETNAEDTALAKLSLRHALICSRPASTEHEPIAPAVNEKISR